MGGDENRAEVLETVADRIVSELFDASMWRAKFAPRT